MKALILVTLTVLLLCGFAGAQTVNTFCSSASNCVTTGNNTHTGTESFRLRDGIWITGPAVDAGMDECAALRQAWTYMVNNGKKAVKVGSAWSGVQAVGTSNCFGGFPNTLGNQPTNSATVDFLPDNLIQVDLPFVPPPNVHLNWNMPQSGFGVVPLTAAGVQASNAFDFTAHAAIIEMGAPDGSTFPNGTPPEGTQLENFGVYGKPSGFVNGSIGIRNQYCQEFCWWRNMYSDGLWIDFDLQNSGTISGSLDSGPYWEAHSNKDGCNVTTCQFARIGKAGSSNANINNNRGLYFISANTSGALVQPTNAITVDGDHVPIEHSHFEGYGFGVRAGSLGYAKALKISDTYCVGLNLTFAVNTCVQIDNNNEFGNTGHNLIENVEVNSPGTPNVFCDQMSGTVTPCLPASTSTVLDSYVHSRGSDITTTEPTLRPAPVVVLNALAAPTANTAINMATFSATLTGTGTPAGGMAVFTDVGTDTGTGPLVRVVTASGSTAKPAEFIAQGLAHTIWNNVGQMTHETLQAASGGTQFPAPPIIINSSCGTATTDQWKAQPVLNGTASKLKWSHPLGCGGVADFDVPLLTTPTIRTGSASNTDHAGNVTLAAGTGTYTFTGTYASAPICVATDTTAAAAVRASASTTVLTLTGTGTDVINYVCVGRN